MNLATKHMPGPRSKWTTPRTARVLVTKTKWQLEEFIEDAVWQIERFQKDNWDRNYWPKTLNQSNCTGGAGRAPCLFRVLCGSDADFTITDPAIYPGIIESPDKWEPWKRAGEQYVEEA